MTNRFKIYGDHDEKTIKQMETCMDAGSAHSGVLCADGHLGYAHPIGGVVGYTDHISISGVGFDIACGVKAIRTDVRFVDIKDNVRQILDDISKVVSFGMGRTNNTKVDHALFETDLWNEADVSDLKSMAEKQLGTVGSGNHFVDLLEDEDGYVWVATHFGSRGLGHKITTKYLKLVGAKDGMEVPPALIEANTDMGRGYLAGIELGGLYAYAGRDWVVEQVRSILGAHVTESVHSHHNHSWREVHNGVEMHVARKGATPAFPGQLGFVGGSMGDNAVILRGVDSIESRASLYSTVHGAGRLVSRTAARGKFVKDENGKKIRQQGLIRHDEWQKWINDLGVTVLGGDVDEAPQAYRRLPEVLEAHKGTIEIVHNLRPFGVIMAGKDVKDEYRD